MSVDTIHPVCQVHSKSAKTVTDSLSVLIPVYNEEQTIGEVIQRVLAQDINLREIVVVDDGSTDGTADAVSGIAEGDSRVRFFRLTRNQGKTSAVRHALKHARGDVLIIQDADMEYDPSEIPDVIAPILEGSADVVYGSRFLVRRASRVLYFYHYLANRGLTFLSNILTNRNMTDIETCYKAFRSDVIKPLDLKSSRFGMEVEITALICKTAARTYEVPISYYGRTYEEGKKIGFWDGLWAIYYILFYNLIAPHTRKGRDFINSVNSALGAERRLPHSNQKNAKLPRFVLALVLIFALTLLVQWFSGAYSQELGSYPDEAAHYVSGLMVHDFLLSGSWLDPIKFADTYYLHYPKMAIGHWGPVFYFVQGMWEIVFGTSRESVLLLLATISATLALCVYRQACRWIPPSAALIITVSLILNPQVQRFTAAVMTEQLSSLFIFVAACSYGRFLARPSWRNSALFCGFSILALLTKGNGLILALLPPLAILIGRHWSVLRTWQFWFPCAAVGVICAPWYLLTLDMQRNGLAEESFSLQFVQEAIPFYGYHLLRITGVLILTFAGLGVISYATTKEGDSLRAMMTSMLSLVVAIYVFHCLVPCGLEKRHLVVAMPPLLVCSAVGIHWTLQRLKQNQPSTALALMLALLITVGTPICHGILIYQKANYRGFSQVVEELNAESRFADSVFLISSNAEGEGTFISEVAMRDHRPNRVVLRASKCLVSKSWSGEIDYVRFQNTEQLMSWIQDVPVGIVVVDTTVTVNEDCPEHVLLHDVLLTHDAEWELWRTYPAERYGATFDDALQIWVLKNHEGRPRRRIEIDMERMLGRPIRG